ncbi:MAG: tetratricopeptide repeat protein [Candidatus Aenigmarchaeota archaeon]|nr:tetratricopeptide repeat protein [Candidatus Aenigmarchaeota archaeon]
MVKENNQEGHLQNQMTSGLSLTERMLYASWMSEQEIGDRELEEPHYYYEKLQEIKTNLQEKMDIRKDAEEVIKKFISNKTDLWVQKEREKQVELFIDNKMEEYRQQYKNNGCELTDDIEKEIIQRVREEGNKGVFTKDISENCKKKFNTETKNSTSYLTGVLESNNINCVGTTSLFLSLAEMLDQELFKNCNIGRLYNKITLFGHEIIRKKSNEGYENIDFDKVMPDEYYLEKYGKLPDTSPKENIIADILYNCGTTLGENGFHKQALKYFNKVLKIDPTHSNAKYNKKFSLKKIEKIQRFLENYNNPQKGVTNYEVLSKISYGNDLDNLGYGKNGLNRGGYGKNNPEAFSLYTIEPNKDFILYKSQ